MNSAGRLAPGEAAPLAKVWVHVTAYRDREALARVCAAVRAQTLKPALLRVADNSPEPIVFASELSAEAPAELSHRPDNPGTAGAINDSVRAALAAGGVDFLWILDQDSVPDAGMLEALVAGHAALEGREDRAAGIVAPLTVNRDDGAANVPQRFEAYRPCPVPVASAPVECDFIPASGMLLCLPRLQRLRLPSDRYFLDVYDFALGLAAREAGAPVWVLPALRLSHQVGHKLRLRTADRPLADMSVERVRLYHQNLTFLLTRSARGGAKALAAGWAFRSGVLRAWRYVRHPFPRRWSKAAATVLGFFAGLFSLPARRRLAPANVFFL